MKKFMIVPFEEPKIPTHEQKINSILKNKNINKENKLKLINHILINKKKKMFTLFKKSTQTKKMKLMMISIMSLFKLMKVIMNSFLKYKNKNQNKILLKLKKQNQDQNYNQNNNQMINPHYLLLSLHVIISLLIKHHGEKRHVSNVQNLLTKI